MSLLKAHIATYGTAADGRLFRTALGGDYTGSAYYGAWDAARRYALTPDVAAGPLAGRPYDLRHVGVTLWLNAGVPAPDVARRAGQSVDVLLKVYAGRIDGAASAANDRITRALEGRASAPKARR